MCYGCWEEAGSPQIKNEKVDRLVELIGKVYEFSSVGGNLHCELDDWNLDDEFLDGEFRPAFPNVSAEQLSVEGECRSLLRAASFEERCSALAAHSGYLEG